MASHISPKTHRVVQIHPRVLKEDRDCSSCTNGEVVDMLSGNCIYCNIHSKLMNRYDECSAFEAKKVGES